MNDKGEIRIGVYICQCGHNIAGTVNTEEVAEFAKELPSVVMAKDYIYMCSDPGQNMIKEDIRRLRLNRVVVAGSSLELSSLTEYQLLRPHRSGRQDPTDQPKKYCWPSIYLAKSITYQ